MINSPSDKYQVVQIPAYYQKTVCDLFEDRVFSLTERLELQPCSYVWIQLQELK